MKLIQISTAFFLLLFSLPSLQAQYVDSVHVDDINANELYTNIRMQGGGKLFTYIDDRLQNDTLVVDIFFTHCPGPAYTFYEDTSHTLSNNLAVNYNLLVRTWYDTNTSDSQCYLYNNPVPIDSLFLSHWEISIKDFNLHEPSGFHVFPNPTTGSFVVDFKERLRDLSLTITTTEGVLLQQSKVDEATSIEQRIEGPPGIYLLKVKAAGKELGTVKVVKK